MAAVVSGEPADINTINLNNETKKKENPEVSGMGIGQLMRRSRVFALSTEGNEYVKKMMEENITTKSGFSIEPVKGPNIEACLVIHSNKEHAVLLGFSETATKTYEEFPEPVILLMDAVRQQISQRRLKIISTIIVMREDYRRPSSMFESICALFDVATDDPTYRLSHKSFSGYDLVASSNPLEAEKWLQINSPHEVLPRTNLALTFKAIKRDTEGKPTNDISIVAITTAYVDFIISNEPTVQGMMMQRYKALLHFEAFSPYPEPALLAILSPTLVEKYALAYKWLDQFDVYSPDKINVGNLMAMDSSGTPFHVADRQARNVFAMSYIEPVAQICLDVMVGKSQLPFTKYLVGENADVDYLRTRIANFFDVNLDRIPSPVRSTEVVQDFAGVIRQDQTFDSRYVDYLWAVRLSGNTERSRLWTTLYSKVHVRAKEMHIMFPVNWEPLYMNVLKFLSPAFIERMSELMDEKGLKVRFENEATQAFGAPASMNFGSFGPDFNMKSVVRGYDGLGSRYNLSGITG